MFDPTDGVPIAGANIVAPEWHFGPNHIFLSVVRRYIASSKLAARQINGPYGAQYVLDPSEVERFRARREAIEPGIPTSADTADSAVQIVRPHHDDVVAIGAGIVEPLVRRLEELANENAVLAAKNAELEARIRTLGQGPDRQATDDRPWWRRIFSR